jgi:hypothetical protein
MSETKPTYMRGVADALRDFRRFFDRRSKLAAGGDTEPGKDAIEVRADGSVREVQQNP